VQNLTKTLIGAAVITVPLALIAPAVLLGQAPSTNETAPESADPAPMQTSETMPQGDIDPTMFMSGEWQIVRLAGSDIPPDVPATVTFDGSQASFSFGCNTMSTGLVFGAGTAGFTPLASTRMACPPEIDELETSLQAALTTVATWQSAGDDDVQFLDAVRIEQLSLKRTPS